MPDASNNPFVCMAAYSVLQRSIKAPVWRQTKRPPETGGPQVQGRCGCLFGGDLPRRIERAGIVDFRDLLVANERRDEPRESFEEVKALLHRKRKAVGKA